MTNFQVERLKALPQRTETWQGVLARLPAWAKDDDGTPVRPWAAFWLSLGTGKIHSTEAGAGKRPDPKASLDALAEFATDAKLAGYRPTRLEVSDASLADHLVPLLAEAGIEVQRREELFALKRVLESLAKDLAEGPAAPGAMTGRGVTVERMRAFAEAGERFWRAAPWKLAVGEELIRVEAPAPPSDGLGFVLLMGGAGETFGLAFFASAKQYEKMTQLGPAMMGRDPVWSLTFDEITGLPLGDADLWIDHDLPVAGDDAYPVAACFGPGNKIRRPDAKALAYFEGLLRVFAEVSAAELDAGRVRRTASTADGAVEFALSLVNPPREGERDPMAVLTAPIAPTERALLDIERMLEEAGIDDPDEADAFIKKHVLGRRPPHREPRTPLEKAQDLAFEAAAIEGRERRKLAERALEVSPDCADAYALLAGLAPLEEACDLYAKGVAAGERALGEPFFKERAGEFWGLLETRGYMRAKFGLAECLAAQDRTDEAIGHYQDLLRLNPNDNQGVRHVLAPLLLDLERHDELEELLERFVNDGSAVWGYTWALLAFIREGDSEAARRRLAEALESNRHVPELLLEGLNPFEPLPLSYSPGGEDEAALCADELIDAWDETPGAMEWLEVNARKRGPKPRAPRKRRK